MSKNSTRVSRYVNAPRARVYSALIDANTIAKWKVPTGMTSHVHEFDAREGGKFRISLTYDAPTGVGKTTPHTDTYHGRFVKLMSRLSKWTSSIPAISVRIFSNRHRQLGNGSPATLTKIEGDFVQKPSVQVIAKIAKAFDVSIEELIK